MSDIAWEATEAAVPAWTRTQGIEWDAAVGPVRPPHGYGTAKPAAAADIRAALDLASLCLKHADYMDAYWVLDAEVRRLDFAYPAGWLDSVAVA